MLFIAYIFTAKATLVNRITVAILFTFLIFLRYLFLIKENYTKYNIRQNQRDILISLE